MKSLSATFLALAVLCLSCSKSDDNPTTPGGNVSGNVYTINGVVYEVNDVDVQPAYIYAAGSNGSSGTSIYFDLGKAGTPRAGTYRVVDSAVADDEIDFVAIVNGATRYQSTGAGAVFATVSYANNKITIIMPEAPALEEDGGATVPVKANIIQE